MIPGDRQSGARTGEAPPVTGLARLRGFGPAGILTILVDLSQIGLDVRAGMT